MTPTQVCEVLDYAIEREQEAHDFYMDLSRRARRPGMREALEQFAHEELGHKKKLLAIRAGTIDLTDPTQPVADLKIADYVVAVDAKRDDLDLQEVLILAMRREKASFRLYSDLARIMAAPGLRETFLALAQEEAKHKLRFEIEYDEVVLQEN
jgi:rubrerythrin